MNQVAQIQPPRLPFNPEIGAMYDVDPGQWRALVEAVFPNAQTVEGVGMALAYCKSRNLDVMKRPVHIVPIWDSKKKKNVETVWPGISEIRTTAARTGAYAGKDNPVFGPDKTEDFSGQVVAWKNNQKTYENRTVSVTYPEYCSITVHRIVHGTRCPFTETVYWKEAYASTGKSDIPNDMWKKRSRGQLAKCAEAAALRAAFPEEIGNDYTVEEMAGKSINVDVQTIDTPSAPPPPPQEAEFELQLAFSDEYGNEIEVLNRFDFSKTMVEALNRLGTQGDRTLINALMEFNAPACDELGGARESEERANINRAFNDALSMLESSEATDDHLPPEGDDYPPDGPIHSVLEEDGETIRSDGLQAAAFLAALEGLLNETKDPKAVWTANSEAFLDVQKFCDVRKLTDGTNRCTAVGELAKVRIQMKSPEGTQS